MNEKNQEGEDRRCSKEQTVIMCSESELGCKLHWYLVTNSHPHSGIFILLKTFLEAPFKFYVATRMLHVPFSSVKSPWT